jgi:hypothetical protein
MKHLKSYSNGPVNYTYSLKSKKWEFECNTKEGKFTFLRNVIGQSEGARRIANIIAGSIKRSGQIDGLAPANMAKFVSA